MKPADPTKAATAQYTFAFSGWSPAIAEVTADATYTATYSSTVNKYTITWVDGDGKTLKTEQVAYGETPAYTGATPTKTATAELGYSGPTGGEPGPYATLRGVECFPSLEALRCANNRLTALELRGLRNLKTLDCARNALTSLNLTGCPLLLAVAALAEPEFGEDGSVSYLAEGVGSMTVNADVPLCAPVLRLPAVLTDIGSEAFAGLEAAAVIIPEGVTRMEDGAFTDVVIIGAENSEAAAYAKRNGCRFFPDG